MSNIYHPTRHQARKHGQLDYTTFARDSSPPAAGEVSVGSTGAGPGAVTQRPLSNESTNSDGHKFANSGVWATIEIIIVGSKKEAR